MKNRRRQLWRSFAVGFGTFDMRDETLNLVRQLRFLNVLDNLQKVNLINAFMFCEIAWFHCSSFCLSWVLVAEANIMFGTYLRGQGSFHPGSQSLYYPSNSCDIDTIGTAEFLAESFDIHV